jgi:hypothetical protein
MIHFKQKNHDSNEPWFSNYLDLIDQKSLLHTMTDYLQSVNACNSKKIIIKILFYKLLFYKVSVSFNQTPSRTFSVNDR